MRMENSTLLQNLTNALPGNASAWHQTNYYGITGVVIFYVIILIAGVYASWRSVLFKKRATSEDFILAGRKVDPITGILTMTATWVGGGYINGTAEAVFTPGRGLVWAQAPFGYSISMLLGGILFARKMRAAGYVTMLDPFTIRFGKVMTGFLYIPALLAECFYSAAILSTLGASLAVILNLDYTISIIVSSAFTITYTMIGGLYSVILTNAVQFLCMEIGLVLAVGFALTNPVVAPLSETILCNSTWLGSLEAEPNIGLWLDSALLILFGSIPRQAYFQWVLSSRSPTAAQLLSFGAAFTCMLMAAPAVLAGAIAASADWSNTSYPDELPISPDKYSLILPLVLQYLTPTWVSIVGLAAISAAVMSSADSSILSASSMLAHNIYRPIRNFLHPHKPASETEIVWLVRVGIVLVGVVATVLAIIVQSIYGLWFLCSDLVYCLLFPQLLLVIYCSTVNIYGSVFGFTVGVLLRLLSGEPLLGLPPVIVYPWYDPVSGHQNFPFKTLIMLISLISIYVVSLVSHILFTRNMLPHSSSMFTYHMDDLSTARTTHELTDGLYVKSLNHSMKDSLDNQAAGYVNTVNMCTRL